VDDFPKRMAPATAGAARPEYAAWLDPADASRRFRASRWVQAHWPVELIEASVPFFAVQPVLNGGVASDPARNILQVDAAMPPSRIS
jgi:hypothetical protein